MDIRKEIKSLLQEGELYRTQGLLYEARECYIKAGHLVKQNTQLAANKKLLGGIVKKVRGIKDEIDMMESVPDTKEMSEEVQEVIRTKFAFSRNEEDAELEGAIALAKFGQFERALKEFNRLMNQASMRLDAARNIIRCHMALDSIEDAVQAYENWFEGGIFQPDQLNKLRMFLQGILDRKGIEKKLSLVQGMEAMDDADEIDIDTDILEVSDADLPPEDILDISSIGITVDEGPIKGQTIELDVSFQSGNVINLLIASNNGELIETLKTGLELQTVQFYSPMAMFNGKGVVASKSVIESGPKQGDYSVDIQIKSIRDD